MKPYLDRSRRIWVHLPPNYFSGEHEYPVLYVLDAIHQLNPYNLSTMADADDWKTDEKLDAMYDPVTFPGIIVVGIEHSYTYRWSEYNRFNQSNMDNWVNDGSEVIYGEGDAFVDFIAKVLKPTIDSKYRTLTDKTNTAIGGGSRAGYLAINAGLRYPGIFGNVMAMSPAVWLAEGGTQTDHPIWLQKNQLINWINSHTLSPGVKFFLYVGGNETSTGAPYPLVYRASDDSKITYPEAYEEGARAINTALGNMVGAAPTLKYDELGDHHASYWRLYLVDALKMFGLY